MISILKRILVAVSLVCFTGLLIPSIFKIGENTFQSIVVLSFYVYCAVSLFVHSRHKLFFVLSLPIFTQFLHIFQKYAFTTGANSLWRLLPYIILNVYLLHFLAGRHRTDQTKNPLVTVLWFIASVLFLSISPNLKNIIWGGITLYIFTIPLLFSYLQIACQAHDFQQELDKYLCLLFIILGLGTFGLVYAGAGYKGSDNLLASRNIADTNVTMAYFILLWPFALLYSVKNKASLWLKVILMAIFIGVVALSFSRGAVFLVLPFILVTSLMTSTFIDLRLLFAVVLSGYLYRSKIAGFMNVQDLLYFWQLRFADMGSLNSMLTKLETISGRTEIHKVAYSLFLQEPLLGHGIGSFELLGPGFREAHSLWYTLLAEQGIIGTIFMYSLLAAMLFQLYRFASTKERIYSTLLIAFICFFLFNHTVGSTFVILPGKSITVNCIAPLLLMCMHFYAKSTRKQPFQLKPSAGV
ncbi:O-antigen ligase [Dyadobacter sp. CY312]|uniref:O-antigen ligase family protein n=1 Tax=Dyadobacter sp. CY312 TaxID=2907303 RepID=UPI001F47B93C|nr:O-antigen ligase family protein [Dyadobacter sp. CY312]MCE7041964.1 O-antigen ligase family protein [Dyadobacter sp. CY312]